MEDTDTLDDELLEDEIVFDEAFYCHVDQLISGPSDVEAYLTDLCYFVEDTFCLIARV